MGRAFKDIIKYLPLVGQLGLSIIMPILLCLLLCNFLVSKKGIGLWVYIPGFIFGIGASFMTVYKVYTKVIKDDKKRETKIGFNTHE